MGISKGIEHIYLFFLQVQYMIEVMFQIIKVGGTKKEGEEEDKLEGLVDEKDKITYIINLVDVGNSDGQDILSQFLFALS